MQGKLEEIKKDCGKQIETKYLVADLSKFTSMAQYRELLGTEIENLDIGVVCANAGYGEATMMRDATDDFLETSMNLNAVHVYYLFKILGDKLWNRENRSCMIVTSSMAYLRPMPASIAYSAQKRFATFLSQGMSMEYGQKIDILSYNPAEVATKLIHKDKSQEGGATISVQKAVETCFRDVGYTDISYGAFIHEYSAWNFTNMPQSMMVGMAQGIKKE